MALTKADLAAIAALMDARIAAASPVRAESPATAEASQHFRDRDLPCTHDVPCTKTFRTVAGQTFHAGVKHPVAKA